MLNITNHQRNVYQDHNEISLYFRIVIIKKKKITSGKDIEKREVLYTVHGNVNCHSHYGNHYAVSLKIKNRAIIWYNNPTPGYKAY